MSRYPPIICLMGPTASGKTSLALEIARQVPVEIISVDSALVYRQMDIGTSKPDRAMRAAVPHHLIDICDPAESYSAARFRQDALQLMAQITERGRIPLLVGGTMLYFRALLEGLSDLPSADPVTRGRLEQRMASLGSAALHAELAQVDPDAAQKIHPNDPQRIQRALEVFEVTGRPISEWWQAQRASNLPYNVFKLAVMPEDRHMLHALIARRFDEMLAQGFVDEVAALRSRGDLTLDKPSMRSVGYRQVWQYLAGDFDYATMREKGIVATRQLAKRQFTWLRREPHLHCLTGEPKSLSDEAMHRIGELLS